MKHHSRAHLLNYFAVVSCFLFGFSMNAKAATCSAMSGAQKVAVIELYTSEGCSSCPAADTWLSKLPWKKLDIDRVIPLALHVDYWNHLGWHDKYSQAKFTQRQRQQSARRHSSFVYTPQILLSGEVYRPGIIFDDIDEKVKEINKQQPLAEISIKLNVPESSTYEIQGRVEVTNEGQKPHAVGYAVVYQNNLANYVIAGENKGTLLFHNFVVRELLGPFVPDRNGVIDFSHAVTLPDDPDPKFITIAAFVQNKNTGEILQALALNACR